MNRVNGPGQEENYVQNRPDLLEIHSGTQDFEEENPQAQETAKPYGKSFVW
jgi:hypothetical protein